MEKIRLGFTSTPDYSGNAKALYEKISSKNIQNFEIIWFVKSSEERERLEKIGITAINEQDNNFEENFKKVKIMFITHDQYINKKREDQIFVSLWHGFGPKRTGLLTKGRDLYGFESIFARKYADIIDYILVQSEFAQIVFNSRYECGIDKLIRYPYPRNEYIFKSDGNKNLEKVLGCDISKYSKKIIYAPTFRNGIGRKEGVLSQKNILNLEEYDEALLNKYLEQNNYLLLLQLHPSEETELPKDKMGSNIKVINSDKMTEENITINEILNSADIMITDYSSIYMDYLLLNRPIIYLNTDHKEFNKDRGILFEDENFWFPGPKTNNLEGLISEIDKFNQNKEYYKKERKCFNHIINGEEEKDFDKIVDEFIVSLKPKKIIPTIIHYLKKDKYTQKELNNIKAWKEILKDYEFKEWDINSREVKEIIKNEGLDKNIIKLSILYKYGGVFLDTDIQLIKDIRDLITAGDILFIKDEYGNCLNNVIGASEKNKFVEECIKRKWFGVNSNEEIKTYKKKDLFVSAEEQYRVGKQYFQDDDKYFNETNVNLRSKISRALKYGFLISK